MQRTTSMHEFGRFSVDPLFRPVVNHAKNLWGIKAGVFQKRTISQLSTTVKNTNQKKIMKMYLKALIFLLIITVSTQCVPILRNEWNFDHDCKLVLFASNNCSGKRVRILFIGLDKLSRQWRFQRKQTFQNFQNFHFRWKYKMIISQYIPMWDPTWRLANARGKSITKKANQHQLVINLHVKC